MAVGYFDATRGETPDSIANKRRIMQAMLREAVANSNTIGGGLRALGTGLAARASYKDANKAETAARKAAAERSAKFLAPFLSGQPQAPQPAPQAAPRPASAPTEIDSLVNRVIQQESGGNPNAVSPKGATGLMQIMPTTAENPGFGVKPMSADKLKDPAANKEFGRSYLLAMLDRYKGDLPRALVAYNWGPGNADKWDGDLESLPEETRQYVQNINKPQAVPEAAPEAPAADSPDMQAVTGLVEILNDPWARTGDKAMAQMLLEREFPKGLSEYQRRMLEEKAKDRDNRIEAAKAGKPELTQKVEMAGETAWTKESAKLFAKRYDKLTETAGAAQNMLGMLDVAEQGLETGIRTGAMGEAEHAVRQLGIALGIGDADKVAGGELLKAVTNRMALQMRSPESGMGMPGAVSDRDLRFLKESQIGIDRSPEGNRRMLDAFRKLERRKIEIAQLADNYIEEHGRLDVGFNKAVKEYAEANPLFPAADAVTDGPAVRVFNPETGDFE